MNWAEIILITIGVMNLGIELGKHGEMKEERYNFWNALLATAIAFILYYYAGLLS